MAGSRQVQGAGSAPTRRRWALRRWRWVCGREVVALTGLPRPTPQGASASVTRPPIR